MKNVLGKERKGVSEREREGTRPARARSSSEEGRTSLSHSNTQARHSGFSMFSCFFFFLWVLWHVECTTSREREKDSRDWGRSDGLAGYTCGTSPVSFFLSCRRRRVGSVPVPVRFLDGVMDVPFLVVDLFRLLVAHEEDAGSEEEDGRSPCHSVGLHKRNLFVIIDPSLSFWRFFYPAKFPDESIALGKFAGEADRVEDQSHQGRYNCNIKTDQKKKKKKIMRQLQSMGNKRKSPLFLLMPQFVGDKKRKKKKKNFCPKSLTEGTPPSRSPYNERPPECVESSFLFYLRTSA